MDKEEVKIKTIIERHTVPIDNDKTTFRLDTALLELESKYITLTKRLEEIEGSLLYFFNQEQKNIIIPDINEINKFKKG